MATDDLNRYLYRIIICSSYYIYVY